MSLSRLNFAMIASLSSTMHDVRVAREAFRIASIPASAMCAGVSKSGSPAPSLMMSLPSAFRSRRAR